MDLISRPMVTLLRECCDSKNSKNMENKNTMTGAGTSIQGELKKNNSIHLLGVKSLLKSIL